MIKPVRPVLNLAVVLALGFASVLSACGARSMSVVPPASAAVQDDPGVTPMDLTGEAAPAVSKPATAWGIVTENYKPLPIEGVLVRLESWRPCEVVSKAELRCPYPIAKTYTGKDGRFTLHAHGGHYLLVIGSNDPTDTRATVHTSVWLHGGVQHLLAPKPCAKVYEFGAGAPECIPKPPLVILPGPERNGDFRLLTTNPHERACLKDIDEVREQYGFAPVVEDEWLAELARAIASYKTNPERGKHPGQGYGWLTIANTLAYGGTQFDCKAIIHGAMTPPQSLRKYILDPQMRWFGGTAFDFQDGHGEQLFGDAQFRVDPRAFHDRAVPYWP